MDRFSTDLAATLRTVRDSRGYSVNKLAELSGVSRAMITKIEGGQSQPTAALLGRLSAALGLTLSELFARTEEQEPRLNRAAGRIAWTDPATGYRRRTVSPAGGPVELVEVDLPAGAVVSYPAASYALAGHQIWVLAGRLTFQEGDTVHDLDTGDCLRLGVPVAGTYRNETDRPCRYLVVLSR